MVWWEQRLEAANRSSAVSANRDQLRPIGAAKRAAAAAEARKQSRGAGRA